MNGQYSVNLIWINKKLNDDERCIFPDSKLSNFIKNIGVIKSKDWSILKVGHLKMIL